MNYYNEIDPFAAQWIRNLIAAELIPPGDVDTRSIKEVTPDDIQGYTQCHFFAGIAGWSLALQIAGVAATKPLWTGSCPCQPFSAAGKRKGEADERHLWPEFFRLIKACGPAIVMGEQVASKDGLGWLDGVFTDLESESYSCWACDTCAASVGAPHIRQRLYWVADASGTASERRARGLSAAETRVSGKRELYGNLPERPSDGGEAERLADARSPPRHVATREGTSSRNGETNQPQRIAGEFGRCGGDHANRLEHAAGDGRDARWPESDGRSIAGGCEFDGMGDNTSSTRLQERPDGGRETTYTQRTTTERTSPWSNCLIISCRDNKARRISSQPGDEPLVTGIPRDLGRGESRLRKLAIRAARANRVGRLKGYGNAIVPEVAAEFIRAFMEAGTA